jgi:hypothetical protein
MTTTYARKEDLDIRTETIRYRFIDMIGNECEKVCATAREAQDFLMFHSEFTNDAISCMCDVNVDGDLIIWSKNAFAGNKSNERIFDVNDIEIRELISKGLTYPQARRFAMHKAGMSISAIALQESTGRSTIQDSIELARKKVE